jgi:N-acetyl-alpha-D-glucosaminyl L-malate synthase BshA
MANENEKIVTHISNFRKVKRIPDVILVFKKIQDQIPAKLMMVGEGPEKEEAEKLCESLGIKDRVVFLGNSNEIDRILCFSDLFLLPSESESFGLAALEAMINKVPVVSSNAGGIPEVNKQGITGFLSDIGNTNEMAENAIKILKDDSTLEKFKEEAFNWALQFDILNILPMYEEVYDKAYKSRYKNSY